MDSVATPQPAQMPSSPATMGTPAGWATLLMASALEAAVLSVGMYKTSLLSQAVLTTEVTSLESTKL